MLNRKPSFKKTPQKIKILGLQRRSKKAFFFVFSISWNDNSKMTIYRSEAELSDYISALNDTELSAENSRSVKELKKLFRPTICCKRTRGQHKIMDILEKLKDVLEKMPDAKAFASDASIDFLLPTETDRLNFRNDTYKMYYLFEQKHIKNRSIKIKSIHGRKYFARQSYKKEGNGELSITNGEELEILVKDDSGWWFVRRCEELEDQGWVPAGHIDIKGRVTKSMKKMEVQGQTYIVNENHQADADEELSVSANCTVKVIKSNINGWWLVEYNDKTGLLPRVKMEPYDNREILPDGEKLTTM